MNYLTCTECNYTGEYYEFIPTKKAEYKLDLVEMLEACEWHELACPECSSELIEEVE